MQKNNQNSSDIKFNSFIKSFDKLSQGSVIITVLTAILFVVKIIYAISSSGYDYVISGMLIIDIIATALIIIFEVFVCIITSNLSSITDLILKNNKISESSKANITPSNNWQCPACKKVNENYVGTCGCGETKPK